MAKYTLDGVQIENEDIKKAVQKIIDTANSDVERIEGIKNDVIQQRDDIKSKMAEQATKLSDLEKKINEGNIKDMVSKGDFDKALKAKEEQFQTELEARNKKIENLTSFQKKSLIDNEILGAFTEAGVNNTDKALPYVKALFKFDVVDDNGNMSGRVLEGKNVLDDSGKTKSIREAIKDFMTNGENDEFLAPTSRKGGSGAKGGSGEGSTGKIFTREEIKEMSPEEFEKNEAEIDKQLAQGKIK